MKVLVYGGTGSQGGAVVQALLANGHTPYVLTRSPEKAAAFVAQGAVAVQGDMADPDSLKAASEGMDGVSFMVPFSLPDPSQAPVFAKRAIEAAKAAGVKLFVYNTSGTVINEPTGNPMYDMRLNLIRDLEASGLPYITIEPTGYMENLLGPWTAPNILERDTLTYPVAPETPLGWIATADVGALVVAALERPELANQRFGVSGEQNLTGPELAAAFTEGLGREIAYEEMALADFGAALDAAFGPGTGDAGIAGYQWQRDNADKLTMWWDMRPVLEQLPVQMTSAAEWATQHKTMLTKPVEA
jgi:uncharacterized protein YbjT (DUF2867 family)